MMKILIMLLILICNSTFAQDNLEQLLKSVAKNNKSIQAFEKYTEQLKLESKTNLNPVDPEFGYKMMANGNYEFELSQGFHFPTLYFNKYKTANLIQLQLDLELQIFVTDILYFTKSKSVELIYYNQIIPIIEKRLKNASALYEFIQKLLISGEGTQLEVNKARLHFVNLQSDLSSLKIDRRNLLLEISQLNGGKKINIALSQYPEISSISYQELKENYVEKTPEITLLKINKAISQKKLQIAKNLRLPSFSVGGFTNSQKETGPIFGISLPLWANRNKVKTAKAETLTEEMNERSELTIHLSELRQQFDLKMDYEKRIKDLSDVLIKDNTKTLLEKSFKEGEISGITFYIELESLYDTIDKLMLLKRDLCLTNGKLFKYELFRFYQ